MNIKKMKIHVHKKKSLYNNKLQSIIDDTSRFTFSFFEKRTRI